MKCCLHRPHLGLDGGLGDVARVGADGSRTVCTIASPAKADTEWCQLKILVPPLPSKLKFSNPAKRSINALAHLWDVEPQRGGKESVERWSAAAGRQCGANLNKHSTLTFSEQRRIDPLLVSNSSQAIHSLTVDKTQCVAPDISN